MLLLPFLSFATLACACTFKRSAIVEEDLPVELKVDSLIPGFQLPINDFMKSITFNRPEEIQKKLEQASIVVLKPQIVQYTFGEVSDVTIKTVDCAIIEEVDCDLFKEAFEFQCQLLGLGEIPCQCPLAGGEYYPAKNIFVDRANVVLVLYEQPALGMFHSIVKLIGSKK